MVSAEINLKIEYCALLDIKISETSLQDFNGTSRTRSTRTVTVELYWKDEDSCIMGNVVSTVVFK